MMSDYIEFSQEIGLIFDWYQLLHLGIPTQFFDCTYARDELTMLRSFCNDHPEFHIISVVGVGVYVNHMRAEALMYKIGTGNNDPTITFVDCGLHHEEVLRGLERDLA